MHFNVIFISVSCFGSPFFFLPLSPVVNVGGAIIGADC